MKPSELNHKGLHTVFKQLQKMTYLHNGMQINYHPRKGFWGDKLIYHLQSVKYDDENTTSLYFRMPEEKAIILEAFAATITWRSR